MPRHRPPFRRHRRGSGAGRQRGRRRWYLAAALLLAYSAWQGAGAGAVTWPHDLWVELRQRGAAIADNSATGWRRAAAAMDGLGAAREGQPPPVADLRGRVVRVADDDTVSLLDADQRQHKVRLFGIDAPEYDQPHGDAARSALAALVDGAEVGVVIVSTDDYGRTVGTVYRGDMNINHALVAAGHAWWYRYYAPHERALRAAQESARAQRLGLWAAQHPVPPWDWRRGRR